MVDDAPETADTHESFFDRSLIRFRKRCNDLGDLLTGPLRQKLREQSDAFGGEDPGLFGVQVNRISASSERTGPSRQPPISSVRNDAIIRSSVFAIGTIVTLL